jgi:hypothetical protein
MGAGTWTGRLAELARALRAAQEDADARGGHEDPVAPPAVSIDGPYEAGPTYADLVGKDFTCTNLDRKSTRLNSSHP